RYVSSDRAAGLTQAAVSAQAQNKAREAERRYVDTETWNRRAQVGQFGSRMIMSAGQGVMGALDGMSGMASMHGNNAQNYSSLANYLFAQAGQMGMYGLDQMLNPQQPRSDTPTSHGMDITQNPSYFMQSAGLS